MMTKHRIGRVALPWSNLEPPIRSPNYYINLEKRKRAKKEAGVIQKDTAQQSRRGRSIDLGIVGSLPLAHINNYGGHGPCRSWLIL